MVTLLLLVFVVHVVVLFVEGGGALAEVVAAGGVCADSLEELEEIFCAKFGGGGVGEVGLRVGGGVWVWWKTGAGERLGSKARVEGGCGL